RLERRMTTFIFETITAAQALAYNAATDTLVFTDPAASGSKMTVVYNAATALSPATVTLIDNADGHAVVFGPGIYGEGENANGNLTFVDGSNLVVGSPIADDTQN